MLNTDLPHITPVLSGTVEEQKAIKESYNKLDGAVANDGYLRVIALEEVPTTEIPVQIEVIR